jgi:predicted dithiol-disulfide oxidoreductase (DUF899 family)
MSNELERLYVELTQAKQRLTEAVNARMPEVVENYSFATLNGPVSLAELFGDQTDLLVVHNMGKRCAYCTLWADGFIGLYPHLANRCAFVVSSPDEPAVQAEFATTRGWPFAMVSVAGSSFAKDMGFEPQPGKYWPGVSAFRKRADGVIERTGRNNFGPGDDFCAVWPLLDLLHEKANGWEPKFSY